MDTQRLSAATAMQFWMESLASAVGSDSGEKLRSSFQEWYRFQGPRSALRKEQRERLLAAFWPDRCNDSSLEGANDRSDETATEEKSLAQLCFELVSARADRARVEAVGDRPRELIKAGLDPRFWLALDSRTRHWIKRRVGSYNSGKLEMKAIGFVLWNLMSDLQRAGFEPDLETLKTAVEESGLLPAYFDKESSFGKRWNLLWVAQPGGERHTQVVTVGDDP